MTRTARILLVDDEVSIQRAVAPLMRSRGYDVDVAGTGADALAQVEKRPPSAPTYVMIQELPCEHWGNAGNVCAG